jgi:hypothetical protein
MPLSNSRLGFGRHPRWQWPLLSLFWRLTCRQAIGHDNGPPLSVYKLVPRLPQLYLLHTLLPHSMQLFSLLLQRTLGYCIKPFNFWVEGDRFVAPYLNDLLRTLVEGPFSGSTVVQSRAVQAVICPYLNDLLRTLVEGPFSGSTVVQSRAVQAVICLAHVAGASFVQYYSRVMPVLFTLAQQANSREYEDVKLQATAIEAATIIGQSIGDENSHLFVEDSTRIMQWIIPVLQQGQDESNTRMESKWMKKLERKF